MWERHLPLTVSPTCRTDRLSLSIDPLLLFETPAGIAPTPPAGGSFRQQSLARDDSWPQLAAVTLGVDVRFTDNENEQDQRLHFGSLHAHRWGPFLLQLDGTRPRRQSCEIWKYTIRSRGSP